ncbi:uncharacterized protein LOC144446026 isoform X2 [Glandiceps talaboti]
MVEMVLKFNPPRFPPNSCPAGGPASNPHCVVCYYHITDHCLVCVSPTGEYINISTCRVFNPGGRDREEYASKLPINDYLIGRRVKQDGIQCYQLYPKNKFNTGYKRKPKSTIYPNSVHQGGIAIDVSDDVTEPPFSKGQKWHRVRSYLDNGKVNYKKKDYCGFLHVIP